jgi:hypothetical protein
LEGANIVNHPTNLMSSIKDGKRNGLLSLVHQLTGTEFTSLEKQLISQ